MTDDSHDNNDFMGLKYDSDKIRMELNPAEALAASAAVFTYGAIKYDDWNWAEGIDRGRLEGALYRHMAADQAGEMFDDESMLPHTWHALCCLMMLVSLDAREVNQGTTLHGRGRPPMENIANIFKGLPELWTDPVEPDEGDGCESAPIEAFGISSELWAKLFSRGSGSTEQDGMKPPEEEEEEEETPEHGAAHAMSSDGAAPSDEHEPPADPGTIVLMLKPEGAGDDEDSVIFIPGKTTMIAVRVAS